MKIRLLLFLVGLAISFALPTFAQQKDVVDPKARQQIEAALMKFDDAFNKHDASAIAALYTPYAIQVGKADQVNRRHTGVAVKNLRLE